MREQRSQWADSNLDAFFASAMKPDFCSLPIPPRLGGFSGQVILPLAHTFDPEEVSSYFYCGPQSISPVFYFLFFFLKNLLLNVFLA